MAAQPEDVLQRRDEVTYQEVDGPATRETYKVFHLRRTSTGLVVVTPGGYERNGPRVQHLGPIASESCSRRGQCEGAGQLTWGVYRRQQLETSDAE